MIRILLILVSLGLVLNACHAAQESRSVRFATFNVAMGLSNEGELQQKLRSGDDQRLQQVATILQRVRPDVVLLNEFDFHPDNADLLRQNYLAAPQAGMEGLDFPYAYLAPVNTGVDSGLDLDNNGKTGDPADAWGFGTFHGQYGMLVLSRFPIDTEAVRSFQNFKWDDMPGALQPLTDAGESWYPTETWRQLKLSSKSHWDLPLDIAGVTVHFLVSHPTPTVFDGPEDRNGRRNHDENRIWADYVQPGAADYLVDDAGRAGGLPPGDAFVIAGDLNADPLDGNWATDSMRQLLHHPRIDSSCVPTSNGAAEATKQQGGINADQRGDPAADTSDFNDEYAGNLRIDFVLPSAGLPVTDCGVFWPATDEAGHDWVSVSDHRLVWLDLEISR